MPGCVEKGPVDRAETVFCQQHVAEVETNLRANFGLGSAPRVGYLNCSTDESS
jgi:hypothetical protein